MLIYDFSPWKHSYENYRLIISQDRRKKQLVRTGEFKFYIQHSAPWRQATQHLSKPTIPTKNENQCLHLKSLSHNSVNILVWCVLPQLCVGAVNGLSSRFYVWLTQIICYLLDAVIHLFFLLVFSQGSVLFVPFHTLSNSPWLPLIKEDSYWCPLPLEICLFHSHSPCVVILHRSSEHSLNYSPLWNGPLGAEPGWPLTCQTWVLWHRNLYFFYLWNARHSGEGEESVNANTCEDLSVTMKSPVLSVDTPLLYWGLSLLWW